MPPKLPVSLRSQSWKRNRNEDEHSGLIFTLLATLRECIRSKDLETGKKAHALAATQSLLSNVYVANNLITMYGKCGNMPEAKRVFDHMNTRTLVSWNCYIQGYVDNGENKLGLDIFSAMEEHHITPDARTYVAALTACANLSANEKLTSKWLELGKRVHLQAMTSGCCNMILENTLINMYGKCGCLPLACSVFDHMSQRSIVSWNALLQGYVDNGENELAVELYGSIQGCHPNDRTYVAAVTALASLGAKREGGSSMKWLEKGREIHSRALDTGCCNMLVETSLVDMYGKCRSMRDARGVFDGMPRKDVVTWTCLIQGYVDNGESRLALEVFQEMEAAQGGCHPDSLTYVSALSACTSLAVKESSGNTLEWLEKGKAIHSRALQSPGDLSFVENALVNLYGKCGQPDQAREIFDRMVRKDPVTWRSMAQGYVENGENEKALKLLIGMDVAFDPGTLISALTVCGNLMAPEFGKVLHAEALRGRHESEHGVAAGVVELYGKCGVMAEAKLAFGSVGDKDVWTWNALLCGYSQRGECREVLEVYREMRELDVLPNSVTFTHLLTACAHVGMSDKGRELFERMRREFGIEPDIVHYTCMVDLLARGNRLEEAQEMVKSMPLEPNAVTWTAVLSGCRKWNNVSAGRSAFESLLKVSGSDTAAYALMANLYTDY